MNLRDAPRRLVTTRWSMIARAAAPSADQQQALGELCRLYWFPLYSFARRAGHSAEDSAELTQEFLADFLARGDVGKTSPERGRFRSYLLQAMRNFLANEWRKERAQKRGGGEAARSFDFDLSAELSAAEARYASEPSLASTGRADLADPEQLYLRSFAMTALANALAALEEECRAAGHHAMFLALRPALVGELEPGELERLSKSLDRSLGAVKVALSRLRANFRDQVRHHILDLVESEAHADDEIRAFLAAL